MPDARTRRRGARLLAAVHDAVLAELAESGWTALTMEAVAARAGVGKASLYRRWPGKRELVLAAVQGAVPEPEDLPDHGCLREDLVAYLLQVATLLEGPTGSAMRGILADRADDPAGPAALYGATQRRRSTDRLRVLVERAVTRGEVAATAVDTVRPRQWEAGPAVLRHHVLWGEEVTPELCAEIVDEVVLPLLVSGPGVGRTEQEAG